MSVRLLRFLVASAALHLLLAVFLPREAPAPERPAAPRPPPALAEVVWLEGQGGPPGAPPPSVGVNAPGVALAPPARPAREPVRTAARARPAPPAPPAEPERAAGPSAAELPAAPVGVSASSPAPGSTPAAVGDGATAPVEEGGAQAPPASGASLAQAATGASAPGARGGGLPSSGGELGLRGAGAAGSGGAGAAASELAAYARRLSLAVARQRQYPASARRLGMEGTVRLQVRLNRDGSLAEPPRLVASSRHELLDAEALRMVQAAAPFAPLPEGEARPTVEFILPVDFSLRAPP